MHGHKTLKLGFTWIEKLKFFFSRYSLFFFFFGNATPHQINEIVCFSNYTMSAKDALKGGGGLYIIFAVMMFIPSVWNSRVK
jgi:hypothetical protein